MVMSDELVKVFIKTRDDKDSIFNFFCNIQSSLKRKLIVYHNTPFPIQEQT